MKVNPEKKQQNTGRQDAYRARTRVSLLKSAQQVLARVGLSATIEDLANQAQVSPATIYNHFDSKDAYLKEALATIWDEWVSLAHDGRPMGQDLEIFLEVCRTLFRLDRTNTLLGRVLNKTLNDSHFVIDAVKGSAGESFKNALEKSGYAQDEFETRLNMWAYCLAGIFHSVFVSGKFSTDDADAALRVSLLLWGLNEAQAQKLTSTPIKLLDK